MSAGNARIGAGFVALAAVWIGVYWLWDPTGSSPRVSFAAGEDGTEAGEAASSPVRVVEPGPMRVDREETGGGEVRDDVPEESSGEQGGEDDSAFGPAPFTEYVIRQNDTFERISRRLFGTSRHAGAIKNANPYLNPRALRVGETILIPDDPENPQGRPGEGEASDLPDPEFVEYTVVRGDTLSGLAQRFYGSLRYAEVIYNANTEVMSSIDDLQIGDVLLIPSRTSVLGEDPHPPSGTSP